MTSCINFFLVSVKLNRWNVARYVAAEAALVMQEGINRGS